MMFAALLSAGATAQAAEVFSLQDVVTAMEARGDSVVGAVSPLERFARLARSHLQLTPGNAPRRQRRTVIQVAEPQGAVLVSAEQEPFDSIKAMIEQLRKPEVRELRLQCTLVRLPAAIATEHGLAAGSATPVDEVKAGEVQKDAVLAKGSLRNLPELKALPLVPFRIEPPADELVPDASRTLPRVRGEAILVNDQQALFSVQLTSGELPDDKTVLPKSPLIDRTFCLKAGEGVMLRTSADKDAEVVVMWLRLVEVAEKKPAEAPPDGGAGK